MLTEEQTKKYYETQSGSATPLSPLEYEKSLLTPEKKEPIIVSQGLADDAIKKADETKARLTPDEYLEQGGALRNGAIPTERIEPEIKEPEKTGGGYSFDEALDLFGKDFTGVHKLDDGTFEADSSALSRIGIKTDPLQKQIIQQNQEVEDSKAEVVNLTDTLRNLDVKNDPRFQAISKGITDTWNVRINEMEQSNTSRQAKLQQTGIRMGSRFVSMGTSFGGVITQEERDGISRVAELESKKQSALASAETAFRNDEWGKYVELIELAEDSYEREIAELEALNKNAIEQSKRQATEQNKTLVDDAVYNVLSTGVMDTASVYAQLRNQGIETTAKDVKSIIASFVPTQTPADKQIANAYEFGKNDVGKLIASGFSGTDIQATQDVLNQYGLYGGVPELDGQPLSEFINPQQLAVIKDILYPPVKQTGKPEIKKEDIDYKTSILIPRIGKQIYGTRISDLETERVEGFVTQGMALGKNQYEIIDDVLGYQVERNQPLAYGLRNTLLATVGENGLFGFDMLGLARLINMGEDLMAVRKVENSKMLEAMKMVGVENFVAEDDIDYINNKVKSIDDLLGEGWSDEVGVLQGTSFNKWLKKKFGYGQSIKIQAKVTAIIADMVNKRAGSAITETEWERIVAPNVPDLSDSYNAFTDKLEELVGDTLERYNSERKMVALPPLSKNNITNPETRIKLYGGGEDPNPLDIQTDIANPLELNI